MDTLASTQSVALAEAAHVKRRQRIAPPDADKDKN
jgi:hypothetical protein